MIVYHGKSKHDFGLVSNTPWVKSSAPDYYKSSGIEEIYDCKQNWIIYLGAEGHVYLVRAKS